MTPQRDVPREQIAWLHLLEEPGHGRHELFSRGADCPWSHWLSAHLGQCTWTAIPLYAAPAAAPAAPAPSECRGYAHLGIGAYIINHSRAGTEPELIISLATEEEKRGRVVGDTRDNPPDAVLQPDAMVVRLHFENEAGFDALMAQLKLLHEVHFRDKTDDRYYGFPPQEGESAEIIDRVRDLYDGCPFDVTTAPVALLRNTVDLIEQQARELAQWRTWGIAEIAIRNPSVMEYMKHWEARAERAERELAATRAAIAALCKAMGAQSVKIPTPVMLAARAAMGEK